MKLFSVYDSKAQCFDKPFVLRNKAEALRGWSDVANDKTTMIGKHPGDYSLMELGEFDDLTGDIKLHQAKISLGTALEFQRGQS